MGGGKGGKYEEAKGADSSSFPFLTNDFFSF